MGDGSKTAKLCIAGEMNNAVRKEEREKAVEVRGRVSA